jgi:hypothetical protein
LVPDRTSPLDALETERRAALRALPWVFLSFLGIATGMALTYIVMRAVLEIGGSCASGGPYVSARQCPDVTWLMPVGIVGGAFCGIAYFFLKPARAPSFTSLLWPALFLSLGWNFLDFGLKPPGRTGVDWGWLVCAIVFALMGGLPLLGMLITSPRIYLRRVFWGMTEAAPTPMPPPSPFVGRAARPSAPPSASDDADDVVTALERLERLRKSGALTPEEFAAAKRRVLAGGA